MESKEEIGHGVRGNEGFILQKVIPSPSVRSDNPSSCQLGGPSMVVPPSNHGQLGGPSMVAPPSSHGQLGAPSMVVPPGSHGQVANMSTPDLRKKRGRPRKYSLDGSISAALSPMPISASIPLAGPGGDFPGLKPKRPYHRKVKEHKLEFDNLGERLGCVVGENFTPHVLTVKAGEDVAMKILSFSQQDSRAICVLSASGSISNVTLRQPNSSGGTLTYEGRFEILSLSGSFMPTDNGIVKSRSGGMSVSLASPDGRVLGGGLAGLLVAATPVQVVVGSFLPGHHQEQKPRKSRAEPITTVMPGIISPAQEGGYGVHKVNFASPPTFHTGNLPPVNNTRDSRHMQNDNNVSSPDGESDEDCDNDDDDDNHSHFEISG